jgi:N-acetylglucosaminyl-diphospho-decaprenol L-rhamnosyltransferase
MLMEMDARKRVDVVVVAYNSGDQLRGCVEELSHDPAIQVVVVDNASSDESVEIVADLEVQVVELEQNLGFGGGCNAGWRTSSSPYVLFLNPDARMSPDDVLRLVDVIERTGAGAVAPRIVDESGCLEWSLRRFPEVRSIFGQAVFAHRIFPSLGWADEVIREPDRYEHEGPCDWASGASLLVPRALLERLGGFDDGFFMYCEDVDLCRRIWEAGYGVVYSPSIVCMHAGGASAPRWRLLPVLAKSRIRYARKHFSWRRATAYRAGVALNSITHLVAGRGFRGRMGHALSFLAVIGLSGLSGSF